MCAGVPGGLCSGKGPNEAYHSCKESLKGTEDRHSENSGGLRSSCSLERLCHAYKAVSAMLVGGCWTWACATCLPPKDPWERGVHRPSRKQPGTRGRVLRRGTEQCWTESHLCKLAVTWGGRDVGGLQGGTGEEMWWTGKMSQM